jgi:outer membrane protein assembly factor BamB
VAEQSATLHALSLTDGDLRWQESFEHAFISGLVTAADDLILVSLTSTHLLHGRGSLLALGADGEEHWRWHPEEGAQRVSAPAVADDVVIFTVDTKTLVVLGLASGEERTKIPLDAKASLAAPALSDGVAYVPCRGPHLLAVALDGEMRWHFAAEESDAWLDKTPVVVDDRLFAVLTTGAVLALHTADGSLAWRVDVGPSGKALSPPATDGERLYVGARDGLYALDLADGDELWHFPTERRVEAAPVVHAGVVCATCHDHHLYALDAGSEEKLWHCEVDRRIEISPTLARCGEAPDPCVIIADRGGTITAVARPLSAEEHEAEGHWLEAARLREGLGQRERAARLYEKADDWQKAAELWCALGRPLKQAEALEQHARSLGETGCSDEEQAAAWQAAAQTFEAEGERERVAACRRGVARCLRLPIITLDVELDQGLVLGAWSRLRFIVRNEGFGPARNLVVRASGDQFEGTVMATQRIVKVEADEESIEWVDICPQAHGDSVPLRVQVDCRDRTGALRTGEHTIYIPVAHDEKVRGEGQTINVFVAGGGAAAVGDGAVAAGAGGVGVGGDVRGDIVTGQVSGADGSSPAARTSERSESATWDTAAVRELLSAAFSDQELTTLCFDHFHSVYENFGSGMNKGRKIQLILDHCVRRGRVAELLNRVREHNPAQYARFEGRLRRE